MKDRPPQMAANENGYFAWIGIMGPADQPVHAWGYRWFQAVTDRERDLRGSDSFGDLPIQAVLLQRGTVDGARQWPQCLKRQVQISSTPISALGQCGMRSGGVCFSL